MVTWERYSESSQPQDWDNLLLRAKDYSVFQSFGWGEYKRVAGWQPLRYVARNKDGAVVSMVQILLKLLPLGFGIAWAPGGPTLLFAAPPPAGGLSELVTDLHEQFPRVLFRFDSQLPHDGDLSYTFNQICRRPFVKINSGFTIHMDLPSSGDAFTHQMTSKHRYYAKKASHAPLRWESGSSDADITALVRVHREMVSNKNLSSIAVNETDIVTLRNALGATRLTILTGYLEDEAVTSCMTFDFGNKSIYMVAATGSKGRQVNAAYAMVPRLIALLQAKGITHFDFGGIDPVSPTAEGVNHFKRGFGGKLIEHIGEWESSRSNFVRLGMNLAILKRGGHV